MDFIAIIMFVLSEFFLWYSYAKSDSLSSNSGETGFAKENDSRLYFIVYVSLEAILFCLSLCIKPHIYILIRIAFGIILVLFTFFSLLFWVTQFIHPFESYEIFPKRYLSYFLFNFIINVIYWKCFF